MLKDEKIISVIFTSEDENVRYSILCKNTEKFNIIEEKFYKAYPDYYESDNNFMVNGKIINKFKTLEENNIKNSDDIIILNQKKN